MLCTGVLRVRLLPRVQAIAIGVVGLFPLALIDGVRPLLIVVGLAAVVALVPTGVALLRPVGPSGL